MAPFAPPALPPQAIVVFEERVTPQRRSQLLSCHRLDFVCLPVSGTTMRVQVTNDVTTTVQLNSNGSGGLRAVYASLAKRVRQERMSALDREYPW
jgi:hypothetical protein